MADATEREREAVAGFGWVRAALTNAQRVAFEFDLRQVRAAVEARVLADVIAAVEEMELHDPDERPEGGAAMYPYHRGQWIHGADLLTRLRAMEGHTDG